MKKIVAVLIFGMMMSGILAVCMNKKAEKAAFQNSDLPSFDHGKKLILFGEGVKGGYFLITVTKAYIEKLSSSNVNEGLQNSIIIEVTVKNVKKETINLSDLSFILRDSKEHQSYVRKLPAVIGHTLLGPNDTLFAKISFKVPSIKKYHLFVQSSHDPFNVYWKINHLNDR